MLAVVAVRVAVCRIGQAQSGRQAVPGLAASAYDAGVGRAARRVVRIPAPKTNLGFADDAPV